MVVPLAEGLEGVGFDARSERWWENSFCSPGDEEVLVNHGK